jgi:hypothetical protein
MVMEIEMEQQGKYRAQFFPRIELRLTSSPS